MSQPLTGVFSTCSPNRPNPVGLHRARIVALPGTPGHRDRHAAGKRQAASEASAAREHVMQYNARKQRVIRNMHLRTFPAADLLEA